MRGGRWRIWGGHELPYERWEIGRGSAVGLDVARNAVLSRGMSLDCCCIKCAERIERASEQVAFTS
jgi:hypothetical protein